MPLRVSCALSTGASPTTRRSLPVLRPRWRKLLRDFSVHRGRTLLVVAAMVVGLAGSASVLDAWLLLRAALRSVVRDVGLAPGWMDHVVYLFAPPRTMTMLGVPSAPDQLQILVRDRTLDRNGVRAVARRVRDVVRAQGHSVLSVDVPEP